MRIVFALGMSRPDSMIAVQSSTSYLRSMKSVITSSSFPSCICPWATAILACGASRER